MKKLFFLFIIGLIFSFIIKFNPVLSFDESGRPKDAFLRYDLSFTNPFPTPTISIFPLPWVTPSPTPNPPIFCDILTLSCPYHPILHCCSDLKCHICCVDEDCPYISPTWVFKCINYSCVLQFQPLDPSLEKDIQDLPQKARIYTK